MLTIFLPGGIDCIKDCIIFIKEMLMIRNIRLKIMTKTISILNIEQDSKMLQLSKVIYVFVSGMPSKRKKSIWREIVLTTLYPLLPFKSREQNRRDFLGVSDPPSHPWNLGKFVGYGLFFGRHPLDIYCLCSWSKINRLTESINLKTCNCHLSAFISREQVTFNCSLASM